MCGSVTGAKLLSSKKLFSEPDVYCPPNSQFVFIEKVRSVGCSLVRVIPPTTAISGSAATPAPPIKLACSTARREIRRLSAIFRLLGPLIRPDPGRPAERRRARVRRRQARMRRRRARRAAAPSPPCGGAEPVCGGAEPVCGGADAIRRDRQETCFCLGRAEPPARLAHLGLRVRLGRPLGLGRVSPRLGARWQVHRPGTHRLPLGDPGPGLIHLRGRSRPGAPCSARPLRSAAARRRDSVTPCSASACVDSASGVRDAASGVRGPPSAPSASGAAPASAVPSSVSSSQVMFSLAPEPVLRSSASGLALPSSVAGRDGTRLKYRPGLALRANSRVTRKCPRSPVPGRFGEVQA